MKTILFFRTAFHPHNRFKSKALLDFADRHDWKLQIVEYMNAAVQRHWENNPAPRPDVKGLIELWKPDGCIVQCGGMPEEPWQDEFKGIPTVYMDRPQPKNDPKAVCVTSDAEAIAKIAAKELLSLGFDNYAYAKWHRPLPWSEERGRMFLSIIGLHGKRCSTFTVPRQTSIGSDIAGLTKTLQEMRKPCGIFAANDETAAAIIMACTKADIKIPDEIAVVSVDNDEDICESLPVTLTSIEQDSMNEGLVAAELLDQAMSGKETPVKSRYFGVKRIVRRASANGTRNIDKRVTAAIEFIRKDFCRHITPRDVAGQMGCSMRHAHRLFLDARRHSILDEIHMRRIELAKEQLRARVVSIESIAEQCGYASPTDFGRVFKRYTSLTPRDWRRQNP